MSTRSAFLGALLLTTALITGVCQAQEITIGSITERAFGYTDYTLNVSSTIHDQTYYLRSQLEFPLDVWLVGAAISADWPNARAPRWSLEGALRFAVSDPVSLMYDHDWYRLPEDPFTKFSYTESGVEMAGTLTDLDGSFWLLWWGKMRLGITVGYRHYLIKQDIIGYEGWQLDDSTGAQRPLSGTARGIYYKIVYYLPHAGIRSRLQLADWLRWDNRLTYLQVFASDYDDHLLRNKVSAADVHGAGGNLRCEFSLIQTSASGALPFASLYADLTYLQAWGDQTQSWYGDDPASPDEDDTGQVVSGIPHDVESLQLNIGFRIGLVF
ncbi:MAG: omptin family outer membrane protease [bacterium]